MSDEIEALARRFPQYASSIRRLQAEDATFREICEDYGEAQRVLKYWEAVSQTAPGRVEEYREMVTELEAEVLAILQAFEGN